MAQERSLSSTYGDQGVIKFETWSPPTTGGVASPARRRENNSNRLPWVSKETASITYVIDDGTRTLNSGPQHAFCPTPLSQATWSFQAPIVFSSKPRRRIQGLGIRGPALRYFSNSWLSTISLTRKDRGRREREVMLASLRELHVQNDGQFQSRRMRSIVEVSSGSR